MPNNKNNKSTTNRIKIFFSDIKAWFGNIFRNIKSFLGINELRKPTPEMQEMQKKNEFNAGKGSDQIKEEFINPPGWDALTIDSGGLVHIPAGTEYIWDIQDASKYISEVQKRCPELPEINENGEFIATLMKDIGKASYRQESGTKMYVMNNHLLVLKFSNGASELTITNGTNSKTIDIDENDMGKQIALTYTELAFPNDNAHIYVDKVNNVQYLQNKNPSGIWETFVAKMHNQHINDYEGRQFVNKKQQIPSVVEISGPRLLSASAIHAAFAQHITDTPTGKDLQSVITAMHENMCADVAIQRAFVMQDRMFYITEKFGQYTLHADALTPQYPNVHNIQIELDSEDVKQFTSAGRDALRMAVYRANNQLSTNINRAIEGMKFTQQAVESLQNIAEKAKTLDSMEKLMNTSNVIYPEPASININGHNIIIQAVDIHQSNFGHTVVMDDVVLYSPDSAGMFNNTNDAFNYIADTSVDEPDLSTDDIEY